MLFPRFSLRTILGVVTALCFFALVLSLAIQGRQWAVALSIVGGSAVAMALVYAALFCFAWLLGLIADAGRRTGLRMLGRSAAPVQSPFATDRLPPVLVAPPPDPEN